MADGPACDALVVIDVQHVFADPGSPWGSPMYSVARPHILARVTAYGDRSVLTRFVAPAHPRGAWQAYYAQWPFALVARDDPLYVLVSELEGRPTLDLETFGKWGPELAAALGDARSVEVVGLATDCCVISTVLAMADAGVAVTVSAAACGGSTPENHERALALMELYAPLVTVVR